MFRNVMVERLPARRAGRVVFGLVLIAGAVVTAVRAAGTGPIDAAAVLSATWAVAFAAAAVTRALVGARGARGVGLGASVVVPSVGVALALPLTLHMPVALALGGLDSFDEWVKLSMWVAGPAHAAFAVLAAIRAAQLTAGRRALSTGAIFLAVVAVACIPYAVFVLPPAIVCVTGLLILPLFRYQAALVEREREASEGTLPRATVISLPLAA